MREGCSSSLLPISFQIVAPSSSGPHGKQGSWDMNGGRGSCGHQRRMKSISCHQLREWRTSCVCTSSSFPPLQSPRPLLLEWGRRWGTGQWDSSLGQQHEEDGLEEVPKAADGSHEPVGAETGVGAHHALGDVCLRRGSRGQRPCPDPPGHCVPQNKPRLGKGMLQKDQQAFPFSTAK